MTEYADIYLIFNSFHLFIVIPSFTFNIFVPGALLYLSKNNLVNSLLFQLKKLFRKFYIDNKSTLFFYKILKKRPCKINYKEFKKNFVHNQ